MVSSPLGCLITSAPLIVSGCSSLDKRQSMVLVRYVGRPQNKSYVQYLATIIVKIILVVAVSGRSDNNNDLRKHDNHPFSTLYIFIDTQTIGARKRTRLEWVCYLRLLLGEKV